MATRETIDWIDVARLANLAEAGFLVDELIGLGLKARIHQLEEFNAATDRSTRAYLIQVPREVAQDAASHIQKYLFEDDEDHRPVLDAFRFQMGRSSEDLVSWRAMTLLTIAGVIGFAFGQSFSQTPVPRNRPKELSAALRSIGRPFMTVPSANQPQFRLSFDDASGEWTVDSDADRDGVFEISRRFSGS
jgi:hypothetical protein